MDENTPLGRGYPDPDTTNSHQPNVRQRPADTETTLEGAEEKQPAKMESAEHKGAERHPAESERDREALANTAKLEPRERLLRESEGHLRLALKGGQMGLWDWDLRTNHVIWDDREYELLGLPPASGLVDVDLFFKHVHADDLPRLKQLIADVIEHGTDLRHEFRVHRSDGQLRWLSGIGHLHRDENGQPQRMVGVNFDITLRRQSEIDRETLTETLERQVSERTSALQMLRDVASMANRSQDVEEALVYCLRRVAEHKGWTFGHAYLSAADDPDLLLPAYAWYTADAERFAAFRELTLRTPLRRGQGLPGTVFDNGKPEWSTEIRAELSVRRVELAEDLGLATAAAFPVMVENWVVGVLEFFSEKTIEPGAEMLESMASVGMQLGRVIERKVFQDRLLTLAEEEHRRIGQELHDDVGQELTGLALKAETLAEMFRADEGPLGSLAREIVVSIDRTRKKTRALSRGLVPMEVDAPGLEAALEGLALRIAEGKLVSCTFQCHGQRRVADSRTATQLYRIAQEAVANALGHPRTTKVGILLQNEEEATVLQIADDGPGLPPEAERGAGVGLQIMRYRAGVIGGKLSIESPPSGGTYVTCRLPKDKH